MRSYTHKKRPWQGRLFVSIARYYIRPEITPIIINKPIYDGDYIRIPVKTLYSFTVYSYPRKTHKIVTIKNM